MPDSRGTRTTRIVGAVTEALGSPASIIISILVILFWFVGIFFVPRGFKNQDYQLLVNTGTTIFTFWMVFVIQENTNRDARALQTKVDGVAAVLAAVARVLEVDDDRDLDALLGLEDGSAKEIKAEQQRVRGETP